MPEARALNGPPLEEDELAGVSSSSPKKLLMADIAGLRPAKANGVSMSEGKIEGAAKSIPKPNGLDNNDAARPPLCLSTPDLRTKYGAGPDEALAIPLSEEDEEEDLKGFLSEPAAEVMSDEARPVAVERTCCLLLFELCAVDGADGEDKNDGRNFRSDDDLCC